MITLTYTQILLINIPSGSRSLGPRGGPRGRLTSVISSSSRTGDSVIILSHMTIHSKYRIIYFQIRPRPSGGVLSGSSDLASLRELEQELILTENVRNIRNNEVGKLCQKCKIFFNRLTIKPRGT